MTKHEDTTPVEPLALSLHAGLGPLPAPDLTLPSVAPDGPDGAHYYRASTARELLTAEQKRWADAVAGVAKAAADNNDLRVYELMRGLNDAMYRA